MRIDKLNIVTITDQDYEKLKELILKHGQDFGADELLAFTLIADKTLIMLREKYHTLDENHKKVILAHEIAHATGIIDEEDADRWAISALTKQFQRDILIERWKQRYGYEYKENNESN